MRVVITDSNFQTDEPERLVLDRIGATLERHACKTEGDVIRVAKYAEALLVQFAPITSKVIKSLSQCRIIVRYGIGVDNIDLSAATEKGIKVCNVPEYCLEEVADHTATLLLTLARKIIPLHESIFGGKWDVETYAKPLLKPEQAVVGLIGVGRIGERVARRLQAFHYQIAAYDPYLSQEKADSLSIRLVDSFEQFLAHVDFVTLHVPLTPETRALINEKTLAVMKKTAYIINTSRGQLIDTRALAEAIRLRRIAGAALDVFEQEPLPSDHPLRTCGNVILTPHSAYYSDSSILELQRQAAEEIICESKGMPLASWVNWRSFA